MRYVIGDTKMEDVGKRIVADTGLGVRYDNAVVLYENFINSIKDGSKRHTMKFHQEDGKDIIRLPISKMLPLKNKSCSETLVGQLSFDFIEVKRYGELTEDEAKDDGFTNLDVFKSETEALAKQRGFILTPDSYISIYHIEQIFWM